MQTHKQTQINKIKSTHNKSIPTKTIINKNQPKPTKQPTTQTQQQAINSHQ